MSNFIFKLSFMTSKETVPTCTGRKTKDFGNLLKDTANWILTRLEAFSLVSHCGLGISSLLWVRWGLSIPWTSSVPNFPVYQVILGVLKVLEEGNRKMAGLGTWIQDMKRASTCMYNENLFVGWG